jgi:hypothetical protein
MLWVAGTRVFAHSPRDRGDSGPARLVRDSTVSGQALRPFVATLPGGQTVSDSLWVIAAPGATRIVLEPKPTSIVAGDTVRFRVTARDSANNVVAVLPLSRDGILSGRLIAWATRRWRLLPGPLTASWSLA